MAEQLRQALLRRRDVQKITSLSRSSLYRKMGAKTFPPAIKISPRTLVWRAEEVAEWVEDPVGYRAPEAV